MMPIERAIHTELRAAAGEYPVTTVLGPRQSGKTTLAQMVFPRLTYRSLEAPDTRQRAAEDPRGFLAECEGGAIIDEVQRLPQLLSYIQGIVDEDPAPGRFILTGSHQPELHQAVSQTLAGRTALLHLLPFCLEELLEYRPRWDPFELCCLGTFPRIHDQGLTAGRFYSGYLQTYLERDVRALINIKDLGRFQAFLQLLCGRIGQVINHASLSDDVGVSSTTIKSWTEALKASYIVVELQPYFENIRKRVIRSPKLYFADMGLACWLLGIQNTEQLRRDPLRGGIYENLIILEVLKERLNHGIRPDLYFYRDSHGNEVDLLIRTGRTLHPVEIKSAATFAPEHLKGIESFRAAAGKQRCGPAMLCYNGQEELTFKGTRVINPFIHGGFSFARP